MPLMAYPYTPRTGDCQGSFESRKVSFAGAQEVDLSKPDNIVQVNACASAPVSPSSPAGIQRPATWHVCLSDHSPPKQAPLPTCCLLQALGKGPLAITIWADSNPDIQL